MAAAAGGERWAALASALVEARRDVAREVEAAMERDAELHLGGAGAVSAEGLVARWIRESGLATVPLPPAGSSARAATAALRWAAFSHQLSLSLSLPPSLPLSSSYNLSLFCHRAIYRSQRQRPVSDSLRVARTRARTRDPS